MFDIKPRRRLMIGCLVGFLSLAGGNLRAALDLFLKLDSIDGDSRAASHVKEIDIQGFSWVLPALANTKTNRLQSINFTKPVDTSSPPLYDHLCTQQLIHSGVLTIQAGDGSPVELITFTDLSVTQVSPGGSSGGDKLTEQITLSFERVKVTYVIRLPSKSLQPQSPQLARESMPENMAGNNTPPHPKASLSYVNGAGMATLTWSGTPETRYTVFFTDSLTKPFVPFGTYETAADGAISIEVPARLVTGFFTIQPASP